MPEREEQVAALGAVELRSPGRPAGRAAARGEQLGHGTPERIGQRAQQRDARLAAAVLQEGELADADADLLAQVGQRHLALGPEVPHPPAERDRVELLGRIPGQLGLP